MLRTQGAHMIRNRRGATLPIVAVSIVMLLGCAAIAIDIGMLYDSRAEAQRAADSAVLAGASALLQYRNLPQSDKQDSATARALQLAALNDIRGTPITASEVNVQFLLNDSRIAATVTRSNMAPLVASVFGVNSLQVAATAHAMYYQGGSTKCLKPFGVPDDFYSLNDVGDLVMIWKKSTHQTYPLITQLISGNNVRDALQADDCNQTVISVGQEIVRPMTPPVTGQVVQGLDYLMSQPPIDLSYNPNSPSTHPYDGFNYADWRSSPRVIDIVIYDPATVTSNSFFVSGFLTIFLSEDLRSLPQGDYEQWGILLPHKPTGGSPCTPPNCSALSWALRLVQ